MSLGLKNCHLEIFKEIYFSMHHFLIQAVGVTVNVDIKHSKHFKVHTKCHVDYDDYTEIKTKQNLDLPLFCAKHVFESDISYTLNWMHNIYLYHLLYWKIYVIK